MPANNLDPVYPKNSKIQWAQGITAALNAADLSGGTLGTDVYDLFDADATNDSWLEEITIKAQPANNTATTVARFWINNGATIATAGNSALFYEVTLPSTTASATAAEKNWVIPIQRLIRFGYRVLMTLGTAPGGSGKFTAVAWGGDC